MMESPSGTQIISDDCWMPIHAKRFQESYIKGEMIGRGLFSEVFKCLYKGRSECACKIYKKVDLCQESVREELPRLLKLHHPHLINVRDIFDIGQHIILVVDFAEGGPLLEQIATRQLYAESHAARALHDALEALQYLHSLGIIYKELKPDNLLYENDLENAKLKLSDIPLTKKNPYTSPIIYRAPEVISHGNWGEKSDIWNIGIIMYILLCGTEPFWDRNQCEIKTQNNMKSKSLEFPATCWNVISADAKSLIYQLLDSNPDARPNVAQLLKNTWITGETPADDHLHQTMHKLREFNAKRAFKAVSVAVLATQRAKILVAAHSKNQSH